MKRRVVIVLAALAVVALCSTTYGELQEGVRLKAAGEVIDVEIGHLVPCVTDWNGDGKKDLIVGQFSEGRIRLYVNQGTDKEPVFKDFEYLEAGGAEISLPSG